MKTNLKKTAEETGSLPAMTGAVLEIMGIERKATKATAQTPNALMYQVALKVIEPKTYKGSRVFDWIVVGTEDDPGGKKPETWQDTRGSKRITRLLKRSGTPLAEDDEEWMAAAVGNQVVAPITVTEGQRGAMNNVGLYYRQTDDDCPVIGLATGGSGSGAKGAAGAAKAARAAAAAQEADDPDPDEDAPKPPKKKPPVKDLDDDDLDND